jgi:hypothetical protein
VFVKHLGQKGEIASLGNDSAIVDVGMRQYRVPLDGLKRYPSQGAAEGVDDVKNIDPGELAGQTAGGIAGYMAGDALGGPMVGFGAAGVGSAIGGALAKEGSDIQIPTEDGITWQDIRLMAGEGKLTKKTVLQAIAVIRKQRRSQGMAEAGSNAMADTAKRLADKDDGKVAKLRAAGDKRREEELKGRNIAKRNESVSSADVNENNNEPFSGSGGARRRGEPDSTKIDAMLAKQNQQMRDYEKTGKFWLKTKDTQQHISNEYIGKAAANAAALELLKQKPELKGNLVVTAYGPGEQSTPISESTDPKVSIIFNAYNPPNKDDIDGWKVAAKTKFWMVGTNKVKKDAKNPLPHDVKLVCIETAMPKISTRLSIVEDWLELAAKAYRDYGDIELVVCTRHEAVYKEILKKNGHKGVHGYFKFDKITKVATPYYRHDKELKQSLIKKDKTMFKRSSGVSPDKRVVAEHNRYEYFDLLEKFMIKRVPIVSLNESVVLPLDESLETRMKTLIEQLKNK